MIFNKNNFGFSQTRIVSDEFKIGITSHADASTDLSIFTRLSPIFNILITRDLSNPIFFSNLLINKNKIILHIVVNGYGSSPIEPYTPHPQKIFNDLQRLIISGFPKERLVLRIDPIIPNDYGIKIFQNVLDAFLPLKIKRCRYKLFLQNRNIIHRQAWIQATILGFTNPYYNELDNKVYYSASKKHRKRINDITSRYSIYYDFESCDKNDIYDSEHTLGCISNRDLKIFGNIDVDIIQQDIRKDKCKCPINRIELIPDTKTQCRFKCVHCTKKDNKLL